MPGDFEARLGPIQQVHRVRRGLRRGQLYTAAVLLSLAAVSWVMAAVRGAVAYTEYGPLLVGRWTSPLLLFGFALGGVGLWFGLRAWRTWHLRVRLHLNGLALVRGRRGRAIAWPDVRALWSRAVRTGLPGPTSSRRLRLELEARDGRRLALDDALEDFEGLARAVKAQVYPLLLAEYTQAFNAKDTLDFGPVRLSASGLEDGPPPPLAWSEVRGAQLTAGRLEVRTSRPGKQASLTYPTDRIPNVELCAQLIQEIGQSS
jgi:hypothetical protein